MNQLTTKRTSIWVALLLSMAALAGCAAPEEGEEPTGDDIGDDGGLPGNDTDGTGDGNVTDDNMTGNETANVTTVSVLTAPQTAVAGEDVTICWQVEGTGTIPHTAVHFDTESHVGDNVTFGDYVGGAIYPDNTTAEAPEGYELPGTFCSAIMGVEAGTYYYRAHAMIEPPGALSEEQSIEVTAS